MKMKKMIICMMILALSFCFVGCGNNSNEDTPSKIKVDNTESYDEYEEKEPLVLKENAKYVLVALKTKYIVINSEEDFANLKVAYLDNTDGEAYAKYYDFEEIGMYNAPNDLHSGVTGKDFDVGLIDEEKLSTYDDWEVVWEMKQ